MLRRRDLVLLSIVAAGLVVNRRPSMAGGWSITEEEPFGPGVYLESLAPEDVAKAVHSALTRLRGRMSMDSWTRPVPVLIPSFLSPGLVVDLGDRPLPAAVRTSLARHRLETAFGCTAADWQIVPDAFAVTGPAAAFAVRHSLLEAIRDGLRLGDRSVSLQPELVWAANVYGLDLGAGWLIVDREGECDVAHVSDGVLDSIDLRVVSPAEDCTAVVSRLCLLHGIEAQREPIVVLSDEMRRRRATKRSTTLARLPSRAAGPGLPQGPPRQPPASHSS